MTEGAGVTEERAPSVAIAVWVKTPGHTRAKTRLAKAIGTASAEAFHRLAVEAVREVVEDACRLAPGLFAPYWAVAESDPAAHAYWAAFPVVAQGEGALGERLARVYDLLEPRHLAVLFIGADSPHVSPEVLVHAASLLADSPTTPAFVLGPALDGGFYLFGGNGPLSHDTWAGVTYSAPGTMAELAASLEPIGAVHLLSSTFDVDTIGELRLLRDELAATPARGAARRALREWLDALAFQ